MWMRAISFYYMDTALSGNRAEDTKLYHRPICVTLSMLFHNFS